MILVVDAIGRRMWMPRPYSTRPVTRSMMIADGACGTGAPSAATGVEAAARARRRREGGRGQQHAQQRDQAVRLRGPRRLRARAVCPSLLMQ